MLRVVWSLKAFTSVKIKLSCQSNMSNWGRCVLRPVNLGGVLRPDWSLKGQCQRYQALGNVWPWINPSICVADHRLVKARLCLGITHQTLGQTQPLEQRLVSDAIAKPKPVGATGVDASEWRKPTRTWCTLPKQVVWQEQRAFPLKAGAGLVLGWCGWVWRGMLVGLVCLVGACGLRACVGGVAAVGAGCLRWLLCVADVVWCLLCLAFAWGACVWSVFRACSVLLVCSLLGCFVACCVSRTLLVWLRVAAASLATVSVFLGPWCFVFFYGGRDVPVR